MKPILLVRNDAYETFGIATSALGHAGVPVLVYDAVSGEMERPALEEVWSSSPSTRPGAAAAWTGAGRPREGRRRCTPAS